MISRFAKGTFTDEYKKTLGVDFLQKTHFVKEVSKYLQSLILHKAKKLNSTYGTLLGRRSTRL